MSSCSQTNEKNTEVKTRKGKEIKVSYHHTIETFMILRSIAENDPMFKQRKNDYKGKPLMYDARKHFAKFSNHIAVQTTQNWLASTSGTGDILLQGILYFNELPKTGLRYPVTSLHLKNRQDSLSNYMSILKQFYDEAKVGDFIRSRSVFYQGAVKEAETYLDNKLIPIMEEYFGESHEGYEMIIIPNAPFGMGFGADVMTKDGKLLYQIISPANDIEWEKNVEDYRFFGFSGESDEDILWAKEYYRDLVAHEFCHSFVTPYIETKEMKALISTTDSLYIYELDSLMQMIGYDSWWSFINEHLVRLAEIRLAEKTNENTDAIRKINVDENGFILIPDAEQIILDYEANRKKYPTFHLFIPELIKSLNRYNRKDIQRKILQLAKSKSKKL